MTPQVLSRRISLLATLALLAVTGCNESADQAVPLPPLLNKATAGSGWGSACPPGNETDRKKIEAAGKLAVSPEMEQRLKKEFPPGTHNDRLIAALTAQGFTIAAPCETDKTIQQASFFWTESGFHVANVFATVYWKLDERGRVVWTKGFIFYSGL